MATAPSYRSLLPAALLAGVVFAPAARPASLDVSPGSGAAGRLVVLVKLRTSAALAMSPTLDLLASGTKKGGGVR